MIGLVDGNNFYVSCERIFNLSLTGKPVAVLSNNDGCVISRSYEFKALGIPMGTPYFKLKHCLENSEIRLCSSNYELYGDISRRIISVLHEFTPDVEQYSIDEAFIHVGRSENDDFGELGSRIRKTILKWIGVPCGVGFAKTKTLAKIANHIGKKQPSGVFVMPDNPEGILSRLPVSEVWGVGRKLAPRLESAGIRTAWQLACADDAALRRKFNITLRNTAAELRGVPSGVAPDSEELSDSISCSRSYGHPVTALADLRESVAHYTGLAAVKLRSEGQVAAGANIYLQYYPENGKGFSGGVVSTTVLFDAPVSVNSAMTKKIVPALDGIFIEGRRYKKAGIVFFGLEPEDGRQLDLFEKTSNDEKESRLFKTVDFINGKLGHGTVFSLAEGVERPWKMKRDMLSPAYTTKWDQILCVDRVSR